MSKQTFNFINTNIGLKVNYPTDLSVSDIPKKFPLFLAMDKDTPTIPFTTDDGKYLVSNGLLFTYISKEQANGLTFLADEDGQAYIQAESTLFMTMPKAGKPVEIKF